MANYDDLRLAVQALSGGKNDVLFDDLGYPSIFVIVPQFNISDVITGGSNSSHPAFMVNTVQKTQMYISKYQNIVANGRAYSLPFKDPANTMNFDAAKQYCEQKGSGFHLMTNAEWAAVALWCKKNGFMPRGNNNFGCDVANGWEKGVQTFYDTGAGKTGRVATGSGPAAWAHDGTNAGIFDLNGNVWEWVGGMRLMAGEIQVIADNNAAVNGTDQTATSTLWKAINPDGSLAALGTSGTLHYDSTSVGDATQTSHDVGGAILLNTATTNPQYTGDPTGNPNYGYHNQTFETIAAKSGVNIPEILKALALMPVDSSCGGDGLWVSNYGERLPIRGGYWGYESFAGVFDLNLGDARSAAGVNLGFRSAFIQ